MSKMEREELEESVQPVRLLLTKVSRHIKNQVGVYVILHIAVEDCVCYQVIFNPSTTTLV